MMDKDQNSNINNVLGNVFNGPTKIVAGNKPNYKDYKMEKVATYKADPIWRSPITMASLTWIGFILTLIGLIPVYKIFEPLIYLFTEKSIKITEINYYLIIFIVLMFLLMPVVCLRSITKKETRHPLFFNYAISGFGRKITIEKIYADNCPICGGKMKYYNKAVEWIDKHYSDGTTKREITRKIPVLQCGRNTEHCFEVDPAENRITN